MVRNWRHVQLAILARQNTRYLDGLCHRYIVTMRSEGEQFQLLGGRSSQSAGVGLKDGDEGFWLEQVDLQKV